MTVKIIQKKWQLINKRKNFTETINLKVNGKNIDNYGEIAEVLNDHFIDVGRNMNYNINSQKLIPDRHTSYSSLLLTPITEAEIQKNIMKLKSNSAPGEDLLSARMIQEIQIVISKPLVSILNLCLEHGVYPDALKKTIVIPVHKNGTKTDPNNYRPISVINNLGKVFEMSIKQRLNDHFKHNNIISGWFSGGCWYRGRCFLCSK